MCVGLNAGIHVGVRVGVCTGDHVDLRVGVGLGFCARVGIIIVFRSVLVPVSVSVLVSVRSSVNCQLLRIELFSRETNTALDPRMVSV